MRKSLSALSLALILVGAFAATAYADKPGSFDNNGNVTSTVTDTGFNQYGYNYNARIFSGIASGWCEARGATSTCLGIFSNDRLVMKWNAAWDACNASNFDPTSCAGAWVTNEWNGMVPGGSGWSEHVKIIWIGGSCGSDYSLLSDGGYCIWGSYEAIFDQGTDPAHAHEWWAKVTPAGLG